MNKTALSMIAVVALGAACAPKSSTKREQVSSATPTKRYRSDYVGPKRRIGVVDFENKSKYANARLGTAASDILITELAKTNRFVVVERDKLDKILEEQGLQASGVIDPRTAVKVGQVLGLEAIVTGAVSEFGVKTGGSEYLLAQTKRQTAEAAVDIRMVDVQTGQVIYADSGRGIAKSSKGSVLGLGTRGGYDETLEGKALREAVVQFTDNIISQVSKKPWSCRIAGISGDSIYLNAGPTMGIEKGQEMDCYHLGKEIRDPTTGLVLGHEEKLIGRVRVEGPLGQNGDGSRARMIRRMGPAPSAKDICRITD